MLNVSLLSRVLSGVPLLVCLIGGTTRDVLNDFPIVRGALRGVLTGLFYRGCNQGCAELFPYCQGAFRGVLTKFV